MSNPPKPRISAFVAMNKRDRAIGAKNGLLWHISDDLKRFKALTTGHPIIMGRKTYESIGRPLPNRTNIIITRNADFADQAPGCIVCSNLSEALDVARQKISEQSGDQKSQEIFIIGGGEIYKEALPITERIYLTLVDSDVPGDIFFPEYEHEFTKIIERIPRDDHDPKFEWLILER